MKNELMRTPAPAPAWKVSAWFNTDTPLSLDNLQGKVVVLHSFQMLCPGCAVHALPQAQRVHEYFDSRDVAVVGLHTVFEHHDVMGPDALAAFLHEYRYSFPVGVDQQRPGERIPFSMEAYGLRGTPSMILIDCQSRIRFHHFGRMDDLELGAHISRLLAEDSETSLDAKRQELASTGCTSEGCNT